MIKNTPSAIAELAKVTKELKQVKMERNELLALNQQLEEENAMAKAFMVDLLATMNKVAGGENA